jgi:hypothetical protein
MLEKEMQKHHALTNYGMFDENIHLFQWGRMFQGKGTRELNECKCQTLHQTKLN